MPGERLKVGVGAGALVLVVVALAVVLGLGGFDPHRSIAIEIEFSHVGALKEGADVQIAGRVVGRVTGISLSARGATVHVELEQRYAAWAPRNAEVFIASKGLLSQRYLEIGPPPNDEQPIEAVAPGERLKGVAPVRVEMVVLRSIENTKQFRELLVALLPRARELDAQLRALGKTLDQVEGQPDRYRRLAASGKRLQMALAKTRDLLDDANAFAGGREVAAGVVRVSDQIWRELSAIQAGLDLLAADLRRLGRIRSAEAIIKLQLSVTRASELVTEFRATAAVAGEIWARIDRGEGTVGGLLHDPEFIDEAKQLGRIIKRQPWKLIGTNRKRPSVD